MLAYHGTSLEAWGSIKEEGILPRMGGPGNWSGTIKSKNDTVYLTTVYPLYFGITAMKGNSIVVIEIDTDGLDQDMLVADEDVLEQVSRNRDGLPKGMGITERTLYYREKTVAYAKAGLGFGWSMELMGTGGYLGTIPPSSFVRVVIVDLREQPRLMLEATQPSITTMNFKYMEHWYRGMVAAVFGDGFQDYTVFGGSLRTILDGRKGIEVIGHENI